MLSIVVPTLNEERSLPALLADLARLAVPHELVIADGGSVDRTCAIAAASGARVITTTPGRGRQLRAGVLATRGEVLCVLHADVRLDEPACRALERVAATPDDVVRVFTLAIDARGWRYRLVEWGANWRTRLATLPYGDQGLIVSRTIYAQTGGYSDVPVMEDVALVRALSRCAPLRVLPERIVVSARRWQRDGVLRRTLRNWLLLGAYHLGIPPARLARGYRPHSGDPEAA